MLITKKRIRILSVVLSVMLFGAFILTACKKNEDDNGGKIIDTIINEKILFDNSEWLTLEGKWKVDDFVAEQQSKTTLTRLMYRESVNQEFLDISVDVMIGAEGQTGGIEFRTEQGIDKHNRTAFVIDKTNRKASIMLTSGERGITVSQRTTVNQNTWYNINIKLNGTNGQFYVNGDLIDERSDFTIKDSSDKIALYANGSGVQFRNFKFNTDVPENLTWEELVKASNLTKKGYDRYNAIKFEYPYIGLGKTTLLVGTNGFLNAKAPKPLTTSDVYRNDPMLIYDYWWDGAVKLDPFTFGGEYLSGSGRYPGIIEDNEKSKYSQEVDISNGKLTTDLVLNVNGEYVPTTREIFVNENGVVVIKVVSDTSKDFLFSAGPRNDIFGNKTTTSITDGFVTSVNLRTDTENKAHLAVKAVSDSEITVNESSGTIQVAATKKPIYFYISPASDLNEKGTAADGATQRLNLAANAGYQALLKEAEDYYEDFYSRSQITVPDLGVGKWYVRSLFYHSVSMEGTRIPPGCYANNVEGFFGGPCLEFDLMFSQYAMLYVNQPQIAQTTIDWIESIKPRVNFLAENNYTDKTGRSISDYVLGGSIEGGYLFGWIAGYDGTPTNGSEVGHEQGWVSLFAGTNYANAHLASAEYTGQGLDEAIDTLLGQAKVLLAFFEFDSVKDIYVHKGVWAGGETYARGAFSESMAAVYSIETLKTYLDKYPEKFSSEDAVQINNWYTTMLPKLPPYGDKITTAYDPEKGAYILLHTTDGYSEHIVGQSGIVGGPTNKPYLWYKTLPFDHYSIKPTMLAIAESGQFDYNFNTGWSATVMGHAMESDFASTYTRYMLRPTSLYDDFYFCENKNDSEDFERSPALGGHGAYIMALSSQLFDGNDKGYIRAFPAISQLYQEQGTSFTSFLATGNVEASGEFSNEKTNLILKNNSDIAVTKDIYIRVKENSGAAICNGIEYSIVDDCFIKIPSVTIEAGETVKFEAYGIEKQVNIQAFSTQFPINGAQGVRVKNIAFGWERSGNAGKYTLIISKNADLSDPIFSKSTGVNTFYYPINANEQINLQEGVTYYWTVEAESGSMTRRAEGGINKFTTYSTYIEFGGQIMDRRGNVSLANSNIVIDIPAGANDTSHTALFKPSSSSFTLTTELNYKPSNDHQQAGLIIYVSDSNYLKLSRAYTNGTNVFEFKSSDGLQYSAPADNIQSDTVWLRLTFDGSKVTGFYSEDGSSFIKIAEFSSSSWSSNDYKVGLFGSVWSAMEGGSAVFKSMIVS